MRSIPMKDSDFEDVFGYSIEQQDKLNRIAYQYYKSETQLQSGDRLTPLGMKRFPIFAPFFCAALYRAQEQSVEFIPVWPHDVHFWGYQVTAFPPELLAASIHMLPIPEMTEGRLAIVRVPSNPMLVSTMLAEAGMDAVPVVSFKDKPAMYRVAESRSLDRAEEYSFFATVDGETFQQLGVELTRIWDLNRFRREYPVVEFVNQEDQYLYQYELRPDKGLIGSYMDDSFY